MQISMIYIQQEISFEMCYVKFNLEFPSQRSRSQLLSPIFLFPDVDLVIVDTNHKFL